MNRRTRKLSRFQPSSFKIVRKHTHRLAVPRRKSSPLNYETIHQTPPNMQQMMTVVTNPAPTLSPVVIVENSLAELCVPVPADGSPLLIPPLSFVSGPPTWSRRLTWKISVALICSPTPVLSSYSASVHRRPQASSGPVHACAALSAEALNIGMIRS